MYNRISQKSRISVYYVVALLLLFFLSENLSAESFNVNNRYDFTRIANLDQNSVPDFNKMISEATGGILMGTLMGYSFAYLSGSRSNRDIFESGPNLGLVNADIGVILGSALGVYLVGNLTGGKGPFINTLVYGLVVGGSIQVISYSLYYSNAKESVDKPNPSVIEMLAIIAPTVGALIGYNNSPKKARIGRSSSNGLLNVKNKRLCIKVPEIYSKKKLNTYFSGVELINIVL